MTIQPSTIRHRNRRYPTHTIRHRIPGGPYQQQRETIRLIGRAIKKAAEYLPLRNHAAALAATAPPKDYLRQVKAIYDDAIKRWRYVKDPVHRELLAYDPHAIWQLVLAGDGVGVGRGMGAGDCDDITAAIGAELVSIGMPVRIGVSAPPGMPAGRMFGHVFAQTKIPGLGWLTVDPVLHPHKQFGAQPSASRMGFFDLEGRVVGRRGNVIGLHGQEGSQMQPQTIAPLAQWRDLAQSMGGLGGTDEPLDWRAAAGPEDFGMYSEKMGIMPTEHMGLAAEVDLELFEGDDGSQFVGARTPLLEITPRDLDYVAKYGQPYDGMGAVSDDGSIYAYDGSLGFFSKIFKAVKKGVKKVTGGIKKVIKKIPGGKYLLKIGSKIWKIAKKIVRPLTKFVGKYAAKLAPVAALIPGYGPAIAAGLYAAGKIANLMNKYGVVLKGAKGALRKLKFKSGKSAKKFRKALIKNAKKQAIKRKKMGKGAYQELVKGKFKGYDGYSQDEYSAFLGAVAPTVRRRRAIRRAVRISKGLPVKPGPVAAFGPRRIGRRRFGPLLPRRRQMSRRAKRAFRWMN
jgi:hypothetical protein